MEFTNRMKIMIVIHFKHNEVLFDKPICIAVLAVLELSKYTHVWDLLW